MKQSTFIILGALVILVLIGAWAYLLFSSSPKDPGQIFTDLGLGGEEDTGVVVPPPPVVEEPVVNMDRPRLRQLTTKPVIGFTEVRATTTDPIVVYYAEAGTGHVYTIRLDSGEEKRISNHTVKEASYASFSPDGSAVAIRAENDKRSGPLTIGTLDPNGTELKTELSFTTNVTDFRLISSSTLLYTSRAETGLVATERNLVKGTESTLFTVPFFEATVAWGSSSRATHYVYPKPTYLLEGYLYGATSGKLGRLPIAGFGLTAFATPEHVIYTATREYEPKSTLFDRTTGATSSLSIAVLPEKCTASQVRPGIFWCGHELTRVEFGFPDTWYRGEESYKDSLWLIDTTSGGAELLVDTFAASAREIDVMNLTVGGSESALYFINKNDNTLWMYEL